MELLCVEAVMKRRELLGLNKDDEDVTAFIAYFSIIRLLLNFITHMFQNKVEDAILSCKIVEIVFESAVTQVENGKQS